MAWNPAWSPDGSRIAFVDDRARLRVLELESGRHGDRRHRRGGSFDRDGMRPVWSPDSRWLAYAKSLPQPVPAA